VTVIQLLHLPVPETIKKKIPKSPKLPTS